MKPAKAIAAVTLAAAAFLACDRNPVEHNGDPRLTLSPDSVVVGVFESSPLIATVRNASGASSTSLYGTSLVTRVWRP